MPSIDSWLYASLTDLRGMAADQQVEQIVEVSRPRNAQLGVTGALIFVGGGFAQLIEGPEVGVAQIRDSICRDTRHHDILTLQEGVTEVRLLPNWSLGYSGASRTIQHHLAAIRSDAERGSATAPGELIRLLRAFAL